MATYGYNEGVESLKDRVIKLMARKGYKTQKELALASDLDPSTIHNILVGKRTEPDLLTCIKLAPALGVSIEGLLGLPTPNQPVDQYTPDEVEILGIVPPEQLPAFVEFAREWVIQPDDDRALVVEFQKVLSFHRSVNSKSKRAKATQAIVDSPEAILRRIRKAVAELPQDVRPNMERVVDVVMGMGPEAQTAYLDFVKAFMAEGQDRTLPGVVNRSEGELQEVAGGQQNRA